MMAVGALGERQEESGKTHWSCEILRFQGNREATMSIVEVSLLTGFYPNQNDLKQVM